MKVTSRPVWAMLATSGSMLNLFCAFIILSFLYLLQNEGRIFIWWGILPLCRTSCFSERIYIYYAVVGYKWEKSSSVWKGGKDRSCKSGALWSNWTSQLRFHTLYSFNSFLITTLCFQFSFSLGYSVDYKFFCSYFSVFWEKELVVIFCYKEKEN